MTLEDRMNIQRGLADALHERGWEVRIVGPPYGYVALDPRDDVRASVGPVALEVAAATELSRTDRQEGEDG